MKEFMDARLLLSVRWAEEEREGGGSMYGNSVGIEMNRLDG